MSHKNKGKQKSGSDQSQTKEKADVFVWTDDEVQLLLKVTGEYMTKKASENVDWESIQNKYAELLDIFREHLLTSPDEAKKIGKDYKHKPEEITKGTLTSKLKSVRQKYRQVVDSGRRSGHGRVVLLYYDDCECILGGSPATTQIGSGIESTDLEDTLLTVDAAILSDITNLSQSGRRSKSNGNSSESVNVSDDSELAENSEEFASEEKVERNLGDITSVCASPDETDPTTSSTPLSKRRDMSNAELKSYKQARLKRSIPLDSQLLDCAKQDIEIKKRIIDQMDKMDKEYCENMKSLSANMDKLTNSIADGFSLLRNLMMPQQQPPQHHQQNNQFYLTHNHQQQQQQMPYNFRSYTPQAPSTPWGIHKCFIAMQQYQSPKG